MADVLLNEGVRTGVRALTTRESYDKELQEDLSWSSTDGMLPKKVSDLVSLMKLVQDCYTAALSCNYSAELGPCL